MIAAQKKADQTAQTVKDAKRDLDKANTKLADAKTTDAQRYGKQVVVKPVNITAGDPVPAPKLANALTLPVSKNNDGTLSLVVNNGQAAELPAGTTAAWANKTQVTTDAQHAGNYAEDVLVTFPDGSQTTVKAQMKVAANVAGQGVSVSQNATISSSSGHRTAENSTSNVEETSLD
ncbi:MAG: Rib/alpha-like domain-containing protein [Limosilactobacillus pontis]